MTARESLTVHGFEDCRAAGERLATRLGVPFATVNLHRFPDGESLVRVDPQMVTERVVLYRGLNQPNDKLIEIVLAASALREHGARHITLVAPYLPYMRQDIAFHPGEAVSQTVIGRWLADHFDRVIAVEPHLHRTAELETVFPGREATALSGGPALGAALATEGVSPETVILGPDIESTPLTRSTAQAAGLSRWASARKVRHGDRDVTMTLPDSVDLAGRPVIIVDDVISSGTTIIACARAALERGAASVDVLAVHALYPPDAADAFRQAGIARVRSADGIPHPSNAVPLDRLLAEAVKNTIRHPARGQGEQDTAW